MRLLLLVVLTATVAGCGDVVGDVFSPVTSIRSPHWSPDGERIVFYLHGKDGGWETAEFYIVGADGGGLQRLKDLEADSPDWQMAHRVLKVARDAERAGLARLRRIGVATLENDAPWVNRVAWSPNGQQIAYSYRSAGRTDQDVYVVRADGSSRPRLVARHADDPVWSPEERLLAVERGPKGIFVVPAVGGSPRRLPIQLPDEPGVWDLAWSPDGTQIAFATTYALYIAEVATGRVREIADVGDA